jgi:hypothetical protein
MFGFMMSMGAVMEAKEKAEAAEKQKAEASATPGEQGPPANGQRTTDLGPQTTGPAEAGTANSEVPKSELAEGGGA